jgi:transglutaminase-like putative cysteine protease
MLLATAAFAADGARTLTIRYETTVGPLEAGTEPVHVWIPLAVQNESQRVTAESIEASIPGSIEVEEAYGNRYWHGQVERSDGQPVTVAVETTVERRVHRREVATRSDGLSDDERDAYQDFLGPNERVVVDHPMLEPILSEVRASAKSDDKAAISRAIYDWVVDNVEYKKVGTGWGNGDTFWACSERYGNCTDFHALFISLARTEGIPARFEIGFPIPEDREAGDIGGYHCWVNFYLPETGWFPVDASEAFKNPAKRELLYGTQPADRIHFSTGRDLRLGPDHRGRPLNYFIYPYVEVGGQIWRGEIGKKFSYREPEKTGSGRIPDSAPGIASVAPGRRTPYPPGRRDGQ